MTSIGDLDELQSLTTPLSPISATTGSYASLNYSSVQTDEVSLVEPAVSSHLKEDNRNSRHVTLPEARDECTQTMTIGHRIRMETSPNYHPFSLREDYDTTVIDVQKSFAPIHYIYIPFILRIYWWFLTYKILVNDFHEAMGNRTTQKEVVMYFSHLTHLTLVMTMLYQTLGCFLCMVATLRRKHKWILYQSAPNENYASDRSMERPGVFVCFTWYLYSMVLPVECIVAFAYWTLESEPNHPDTAFNNLYKHGIIAFLLFADGYILGRIPLRIKHLSGPIIYGTAYVLWSIIFAYYRLGTRHGFIYRALDWNGDPYDAGRNAVVITYIFLPLCYCILWFLALPRGQRCCCICCCGSKRRVISNETIIWSRDENHSRHERFLRKWYEQDEEVPLIESSLA